MAILTIDTITQAMRSSNWWLNFDGPESKIVAEAMRCGYVKRLSHTQVQWTEEGLAKARRELPDGCGPGSTRQGPCA